MPDAEAVAPDADSPEEAEAAAPEAAAHGEDSAAILPEAALADAASVDDALAIPLESTAIEAGRDASVEASPPPLCTERSGTFTQTLVERSGTCGQIPDQIFSTTSQEAASMLQSGCTGSSSTSADNCDVTLDVTCPGAAGYHVTQRGKVTWSNSGASATGVIQLVITTDDAGAAFCSSIYDVIVRRL